MNNSTSLEVHEFDDHEEEEENAPSLCDFPLNSCESERNNESSISYAHHHQRRSSQQLDSFEFSNDLSSDSLSHAEDIIHCGKLMPYKQQPSLLDDQALISPSNSPEFSPSPRYCKSLPPRSNSYANTRLMRSSRSLDRKNLRRNSSRVVKPEASDIHRGLVKSEGSKAWWKPRWYDLTFGFVKFPPEMDLRDMRIRQSRRNPGGITFTAATGGDRTPENRSDRRSSWGHDFLRVLSCKNHPGSVAVTASIGLLPQL
ncbi:hypothetical protein AAHA92_31441 [Salvia divinorum]|uniref:Uncharacterized protein n=1 Tax=Salvia divinorum TaxID=28513 RepID=A0ABD1FQD6_SALDI